MVFFFSPLQPKARPWQCLWLQGIELARRCGNYPELCICMQHWTARGLLKIQTHITLSFPQSSGWRWPGLPSEVDVVLMNSPKAMCVCVCMYCMYVCMYGGTYVFNMVACGTGGLMSEPRAPNPLPCKHTSVVLDSERSSCWVEHRTNSSHEIVKGVSCHGLGHTFHVRRGSQMWISELTAVYESAQGADQVDCLLYQVLYREFATLKF